MKRICCISAVAVAVFAGPGATAADLGSFKEQYGRSWSGLYIGGHLGASWGSSQVDYPDPVIYGNDVTSTGPLAGGQIGYNLQMGRTVFGVEASISGADLDGTNTCYAMDGGYPPSDCRVRTNILGDVTARLGVLLGSGDRTLAYVKAGGAWANQSVSVTINGYLDPLYAASTDVTRWGWTVGGGVEHALSGGWSLNAEYAYYGFGSEDIATPPGYVTTTNTKYIGSISQDLQVFKLGLNYRFGARGGDEGGPGFLARSGGWEFEAGGRYWYSINKYQKDLATPSPWSRLTYDGLQGNSGEFFGRVESPSNVFVKGYIGGGSLGSGHMNDEDWGIQGRDGAIVPYSNTISAADGSMAYGSVDVGYDLFRTPDHKVGVFVGYHRLQQSFAAKGCLQIASNNAYCVAGVDQDPETVTGITEDNSWDSLRLGLAGEVLLAPRLKLTADAAWVPYTHFTATDHHIFGDRTFPQSGDGNGVQIDAMLTYYVTEQLSLGVGGRYWAMKTTDGSYNCINCDFTNPGSASPSFSASAAAQEYGLLVQGSYKFGRPVEPLK